METADPVGGDRAQARAGEARNEGFPGCAG